LYLSISQASTICTEFNNTESGMERLESQASKEAAWRSRLQRHAQSGKSVAAFCRDESVSTASFYIWRTKLDVVDGDTPDPEQPAAFIDLGVIANAAGVTAMQDPQSHPPASAPLPTSKIDVRIDLGGGIVLTITKR
jgi:hypothetical protein